VVLVGLSATFFFVVLFSLLAMSAKIIRRE